MPAVALSRHSLSKYLLSDSDSSSGLKLKRVPGQDAQKGDVAHHQDQLGAAQGGAVLRPSSEVVQEFPGASCLRLL
eukprot:s10310_g3.t1